MANYLGPPFLVQIIVLAAFRNDLVSTSKYLRTYPRVPRYLLRYLGNKVNDRSML